MFQQRRESIYLGAILLLAFLFYAAFIFRTVFSLRGTTYFTLIDDAMISMRYARNLSNGYGLVWNIGQPPVEGFTNMGWTLYMALLHTFPVSTSKVSLLVMITSAFFLLGIALLSFKLCKIIDPHSITAPLIATTITAFYFPLVFWSLRGMEVGVVTFLVYFSVLLVMGRSKPMDTKGALLIGCIMLAAILVRLDALLQITLILGYILYDQMKRRAPLLSVSPILFFYLATILAVLLFQYSYFGSVFPNTYYLKVTGVSWLERLGVGIQAFAEYASRDVLTPVFIIIAGLLCFRPLREKRVVLLAALFLVQCLYSLYVGGDFAEEINSASEASGANRFIAQGMPSVIILFGITVDYFSKALGPRNGRKHEDKPDSALALAVGIGLAGLAVMSGASWFRWTIYNAPYLASDIERTSLGILIKDHTDKSAVIAVHAAGQIPYYSERRTIDLLGINDPVVAMGPPAASFRPGHNKWNYEYSIMTLRPDLIADEWGQLSAFLADKPDYLRLDNGIWVRRDSTLINIKGLSKNYR